MAVVSLILQNLQNTSFMFVREIKWGLLKKEKAIELNIEMVGEEEFITRFLSHVQMEMM